MCLSPSSDGLTLTVFFVEKWLKTNEVSELERDMCAQQPRRYDVTVSMTFPDSPPPQRRPTERKLGLGECRHPFS